jgi:hypothetical protein
MKKHILAVVTAVFILFLASGGCKKNTNPSTPAAQNTMTVTCTLIPIGTETTTHTATASETATATITCTMTILETSTPVPGSGENVNGRVDYPSVVKTAPLLVVFDTDAIPANGNEVITIVASTSDNVFMDYSGLVPQAIYYLYACVDVDGSGWASGPSGGDFFGYYDTTVSPLNPPADVNAKVFTAGPNTFNFELGIFPTATSSATATETITETSTVTATVTPTRTPHLAPSPPIPPVMPDSFEPDGTYLTSKLLGEGAGNVQDHNFNQGADNDWVNLSLTTGNRYRVYIQNSGTHISQPSLKLFNTDGATVMASADDGNGFIEFKCFSSGTYYARFLDKSSMSGGYSTYQFGLSLVATPPAVPLIFADALDKPSQTFTHGGDAQWLAEDTITSDTIDAVESPLLTDSQSSYFETSVYVGPAQMGHFTFYYKVSSEESKDYLNFYLNGTLISSYSGEVNWTYYNNAAFMLVPDATNVIRIEYVKDGSGSRGYDKAWIDQVTVTVY